MTTNNKVGGKKEEIGLFTGKSISDMTREELIVFATWAGKRIFELEKRLGNKDLLDCQTFSQALEREREAVSRKNHQIVSGCMSKLLDIGENYGVAVRVETDNSKAITTIIGQMEKAMANKLLKEAREELLSLLSPNK